MKNVISKIKTPFLFFVLVAIIVNSFQFVLSILEGYAVNAVIGQYTFVKNDAFLSFGILLIVIVAAYIMSSISTYFYYMLSNKFGIYTAKSVSRIFYNQLFQADSKTKSNYSSQQAFEQVFNNANAIAYNSLLPLVNFLSTAINLAVILIFFGLSNIIAFAFVIGILLLSALPNFIFYKKISWYVEQNQLALNQLTSKLTYYLKRYLLLYFSNNQELLYKFIENEVKEYYQKVYHFDNINVWNNNLSNAITEIGVIVGLIVLGFLYIKNPLSISIGLIYTFKKGMDDSKDNFSKMVDGIKYVLASKVLYKMLDLNFDKDRGNVKMQPVESIQVKNLTFGYENKLLFNNFNYTFKKGKKYAIIGPSGCGKSTLLNLLINNINDYQGQILVNNTDVKTYTDASIKDNLSYLNAENFVFDVNPFNNVSLLENNEEKVLKALKQAYMDEEVIQKFKDKDFDSYNNLSLGQKQRLTLARSFYQEKDVMLLDETLSNLNKDLSDKILNTLLESSKTILLVSHHLNTEQLEKFDEVIKLG
ncbi:ATP-binding cassette domain-containing protein [Mycoplasma sp. 4423]